MVARFKRATGTAIVPTKSDREITVAPRKKTTLDKDLKKVLKLDAAGQQASLQVLKLGLGLLFLTVIYFLSGSGLIAAGGNPLVITASVIGGYMAMNIGANDVANTMGPAVGSRTLSIGMALVIAAVFNVLGAVVAGGDVVQTVSRGIIDVSAIESTDVFIWAMIAALLAAAVWVNLATYIGAPVSTTHAIVGGVMGSGIAAASFSAVNWPAMTKIAASWIISPVMGGCLAALLLFAIETMVLSKEEKIEASKRWVPIFVSLMTGIFAVYLVMKGLKKVWVPGPEVLIGIGLAVFFLSYILLRPVVAKASDGLENRRRDVAKLFKIPLIISTCLLAFAHGANDVSNAIGPLAGVLSAVTTGDISGSVATPVWVFLVGGVGIGAGISLFGPKLMKVVGEKITKLDPIRAYAVALAAATTVIIASALGLPVSSTHVALGGIFGVGFLREFLTNRRRTGNATVSDQVSVAEDGSKKVLKRAKKNRKRRLIRRNYIFSIAAAWVITVPCAAFLAGIFFFMLRGMLLP